MTGQQSAYTAVKDMMEKGMSADDANVELIRIMGVMIVESSRPRQVRAALNQAVKDGRLGHLKKDKLKPEAYFHPNSRDRAKEERHRHKRASLYAMEKVMLTMSDLHPADKTG